MSNQSFFTDKTYARGDEAYVSAELALTAAEQAAADAQTALEAVAGFDPDGQTTTFFQTTAPTEGMTNGDMWIDSDNGNHLWRYVDKYGLTAHTNLCPNPNGQYGVQSWTASYGTIASDNTVLYDTRYSLRSVVNSVAALPTMQISVVASAASTYTVSAYMRSSTASAITKYKGSISFRNGANTDIGGANLPEVTATTADDWVRLSITGVTAPAGTLSAVLTFGPSDATQVQVSDAYFLNGVMWESGSTLNPAISGDLDGCIWTGTPGASSSTYNPGWIDVQDQSIATALLNAAGAQATADGKIRTFAQTTAPAMTNGTNIGDLWMDTDDNNKMYRWSGTAWVVLADPRVDTQAGQISTIQGQLTGINGLLDSKAVIYVQTTDPNTGSFGANEKGDIWINTGTSDRVTKTWDGTAWVNITNQAQLDTLALVNTKITTWYQTAAPSSSSAVNGDLWVDTDDGNKLYRWTAPIGNSTRTNYARNPQPTSVTNWSGLSLNSVVTAPWNASRLAYQTTGNGAGTAFIFAAPSPVAFTTGETVTVSATVDLPVGTYYRFMVHVRTGNKYYNAGKTIQASPGGSFRVSDQAILTANDPDVDAALLIYSSNAGGVLGNGVTVRMGDVLIEKTPLLLSYFDGGSGAGSTWSGTANNSTSVYTPAWTEITDSRTAQNATDITTVQSSLTTLSGRVDGKAVVWYQPSAPTGLVAADQGDIWIDSDDPNRLTQVWSGTAWTNITDQKTLDVLATVNTKVTTFYSTSAPTATAIGDLWIDTDDNNRLYRASAVGSGSWVEITDPRIASTAASITTIQGTLTTQQGLIDGKAVIWVQNTAPTGLTAADKGDIWINTTTSDRVTKVWDGTAFVDVTDTQTLAVLSTVNTKITTFYQTAAPSATAIGDLWVDTDDGNKLYRATATGTGSWVEITDTRTAANASAIATLSTNYTTLSGRVDGKAVVWYQPSAPTGLVAADQGDIWIDSDDPNRLTQVWSGTAWTNITDSTALSALSQVTGKITTFFSATAPTATAIGDLWIDSDDNKLYRATAVGAASWVLVQDAAIPALQTAVTAAQTTANGKNTVSYSTSTPGTTANTAGDIWYQYGTAGQLIGFWIGQGGTSWQLQQLTNTVIANMDAAKITSGFMDVGRLQALSISVDKLALGVLRTNPVSNPGFEDAFTMTNFTDAGQGDINQWRRTQTTNATVYRGAAKAHGGSYRGSLGTVPTTGTSGDIAELYTSTMLLEADKEYNLTFSAISTGAGALAYVGCKLYVDIFFGGASTSISSANAYNQSLSTEVIQGDPDALPTPIPDVTNPFFTVPYSAYASITAVTYEDYSASVLIPAGQTDLWATVRFRVTGMGADSLVYLDDVALVPTNSTGATEITAAGLRVFGKDGMETVALVNNRPSFVSMQDADGNTMATFDANGLQATTANFSGDGTSNYLGDNPNALVVGGIDYADRMSALAQGVLVQVYKGDSLYAVNKIRTEYGIYEVSWTAIPGRIYRVICSGGAVDTPVTGGTLFGLTRLRYTNDGTTPTITNGAVSRSVRFGMPVANQQYSVPTLIAQGRFGVSSTGSPTVVRLLYTMNASNAGASDYLNYSNGFGSVTVAPIECLIEDLGLDVPDTFLPSAGGGTLFTGGTDSGGGSTPTVQKKTYTQTWTANSSQTRRGVSGYGNYTVNTAAPSGYNLAGYYSSSNGNQRAYYGFTGTGSLGQTISTAISGATVSKVELYVKNSTFYASAGGSQRFGLTSLSGMPSSGSASSTVAGTYTSNISFSPGASKWITLPSAAISTLTGGGRVAIIGPGSSNSQSYYSTWYDHVGSYAPQLRVTYTK